MIAVLIVVLALVAGPLGLVYAGWLPPAAGLVSVGAATALVFWKLRDRIHGILLVFVGVLLVSTMVASPRPKIVADDLGADDDAALAARFRAAGPFRTDLPVTVHLIFDEMQSTGAIDTATPAGEAARAQLLAVADRHGLRTFDSVYSRYFFSGVSMPNMMNAEFEGRTDTANHSTEILPAIRDNAYFDRLAERGYRTAVFQTSHLDFCAHPGIALCETFDSFDPGAGAATLDLRTRTVTLWSTLLRAWEPSYVSVYGLRAVRRYYGLEDRPIGVLGTEGRFDVQRFPAWFDRFVRFVTGVPRGTHVFAHFMVPHSPYLLTRECVVSGTFDAGYYLGRNVPDPSAREAARRRFTDAYLAQLQCVASKIDELLDAMASVPALADARLIIQGDHGSRISMGNVLEGYEPRDFIANYGAYFAVKAPGAAPGVDCEFLSLPEAFRRYADPAGPLPPLDRPHPPVVVTSNEAGGRKVEAVMPVFGCAGGDR
ncbi:MAG: sulfatase-like hydrolase/transferase [Vicinamibacterales bacterium]